MVAMIYESQYFAAKEFLLPKLLETGTYSVNLYQQIYLRKGVKFKDSLIILGIKVLKSTSQHIYFRINTLSM